MSLKTDAESCSRGVVVEIESYSCLIIVMIHLHIAIISRQGYRSPLLDHHSLEFLLSCLQVVRMMNGSLFLIFEAIVR